MTVGSQPMDEPSFDVAARDELRAIEDALVDVDPDDVEIGTSDGILRLDLVIELVQAQPLVGRLDAYPMGPEAHWLALRRRRGCRAEASLESFLNDLAKGPPPPAQRNPVGAIQPRR